MTCSRCGASNLSTPPVKRFEVVWGIDPKQGVLLCVSCAKAVKHPKPKTEAA